MRNRFLRLPDSGAPRAVSADEVIPNPVTVAPGRRPFLPAASPSRRRPLRLCARSRHRRQHRRGEGGGNLSKAKEAEVTEVWSAERRGPGQAYWKEPLACRLSPVLRVRSILPRARSHGPRDYRALAQGWCWILRWRTAVLQAQAPACCPLDSYIPPTLSPSLWRPRQPANLSVKEGLRQPSPTPCPAPLFFMCTI